MLTPNTRPDRFRVVFVCTGNRARSPLAAALFHRHAAGLPSEATSLGTMRLENQPALVAAVRAGRRLGVDLSGHTSRTLSPSELSAADVVLGFEPEHVSMSVIDGGSLIERTFLFGELVTLLENGAHGPGEPRARARAALALADTQRVRSRPDRRYAVPDPIGMSDRDVERIASSIDELVRRLVRGLFGRPGHEHLRGGRS
jgi:protein-tyrosine-phosphatase